MRFSGVVENCSPDCQNNESGDCIKYRDIIHGSFVPHYVYENNESNYTGNNICDNKTFVHVSDFNINTLIPKMPTAKAAPTIKVGILTAPVEPGIKNPTTAEANNILAMSANVLEINLTWSLFRRMDKVYQIVHDSVNFKFFPARWQAGLAATNYPQPNGLQPGVISFLNLSKSS